MEMMGGMFGAAGSIAGAFIAADAQKYSANTNWAIALMNYYARERERTQARFEAQRVEAKQNLGMTDIEGTKTQFQPGVGWVTTPTEAKKGLMARETAEKMAQFRDAQIRRQQIESNQAQQIKERGKAEALFDEMKQRTTPSATELEHLIGNAATTGTNRAFDDTAKVAARQAMRTGVNPSKVMSEIARQRGKELGNVAATARTQALSLAPQLEDQEQKMQANMYNLFATRASAMPEVSFSPTPIDSSAAQNAMRGSAGSGELAVKAAMMEGGRLPFVPPNYGMANAIGASGAALGGLSRNMNQQGVKFGEDTGINNLWNSIKDTYRGNIGVF